MQECACCTMTSLCRDMACLSRALWQSHTCSTYAKGLTKPEIHQSAFTAHRRTHRDLRRMHVHAEMRTHAHTNAVLMWHCLRLQQGGSPSVIISNELGYEGMLWQISKYFICFDLLVVWARSPRSTTGQFVTVCKDLAAFYFIQPGSPRRLKSPLHIHKWDI